jgi:KDO2-lipid IV(A) lauroyltransferase
MANVPRHQISKLARVLGAVWYCLDRGHRQIAHANMVHALGSELRPQAIRCLVKSNFVQLTRVALEIPSLLKLNRKNLADRVVFSGLPHLQRALKKESGTLLLTAHLGNWELMALAGSLVTNKPFHLVVRQLDWQPLDQILTEIRCRTGNTLINKNTAAKPINRFLRKKQTVGILLDQNASWHEGVYVPFFGKTACTNKGLAMFALRHDVTVLPVFNTRQADGRYKITVDPPLTLVKSGDLRRDVVENTAIFNQIIEKHIRCAPDNWLWVHRRWREKKIPEHVRGKVQELTLNKATDREGARNSW